MNRTEENTDDRDDRDDRDDIARLVDEYLRGADRTARDAATVDPPPTRRVFRSSVSKHWKWWYETGSGTAGTTTETRPPGNWAAASVARDAPGRAGNSPESIRDSRKRLPAVYVPTESFAGYV